MAEIPLMRRSMAWHQVFAQVIIVYAPEFRLATLTALRRHAQVCEYDVTAIIRAV
jgi:NADH:ubiquinone oxidoreductase subunit H